MLMIQKERIRPGWSETRENVCIDTLYLLDWKDIMYQALF